MSEKYIVEGYWDCGFCGHKEIKGSKRECPSCGKPRGEDVKFYLKEFDEEHAIESNNNNPDWLCEFCSSYNPDSADKCLSCGAEKTTTTYHTSSQERIHDDDCNGIDDSAQISNEERDHQSFQRLHPNREHHESIAQEVQQEKPFSKKPFIFLSVFAIIGLLIWFFTPKSVEIHVTDVSWERHIQIQQWQTVSESDWNVPINGRVYDKKQEIHHYDHVLDYYETYYETVSEQVVDHYKTIKNKKDLGNGKFEITEEKEPVYKTVTHKEKRQKPIYRDVPIYQTKFYYKLERWKDNRTIDTSAHDKSPYFGEIILAKGKQPYDVGKEQESGRSSKYFITGTVKDKSEIYEVDDENWWNEIHVGDTLNVKVTFNNHITK